jgi:hypothetical protein
MIPPVSITFVPEGTCDADDAIAEIFSPDTTTHASAGPFGRSAVPWSA